MKKLFSIVLCTAAVSAFADPAEVELGAVGVTTITSSLSNTIVAVSYDDLAGGSGMVYSNLVKTTNLTAGDRLVEFRDDVYTGWVLVESDSVKYWKEEMEYFQNASGEKSNSSSPTADTVRGAVGTGIWLVRQNPTDENGNAIPFYIYGKPVSNPKTVIVGGVANLVGNPTANDVQLTTAILTDATAGDRIEVPSGIGVLGRQAYTYDKTNNQWWTIDTGSHLPVNGLPKILAGQGFWYVSAAPTGTSFTISWPKAN